MDKELITRKVHECGLCTEDIPIGCKAFYSEGKSPKFNSDEKQIGIEYWKQWFHIDCIMAADSLMGDEKPPINSF